MKLPQDFTFETLAGIRCRMKLIGDNYYCSNVSVVPTTANADWSVKEVHANFDDESWTLLENLDKPTYPDQFSFYHAGTTQQFNMVRLPYSQPALWSYSKDGDKFRGATYTAEMIEKLFENGDWEECSFAEEAMKEPEMVFPFTFVVEGGSDILYEAPYQMGDLVQVNWDGCINGMTYHIDSVRKFIKNGTWIVKSVGEAEQQLVFPIIYKSISEGCCYKIVKDSEGVLWWECQNSNWRSTTPNLYSYKHVAEFIKVGDWIVQSVGSSKSVGPQKAPETPPSPLSPSSIDITKTSVGSVSKLSMKLGGQDVEEASEKLERLANAVERVNISLEGFADIFADVQHLITPKVEVSCDASREVNWNDFESSLSCGHDGRGT